MHLMCSQRINRFRPESGRHLEATPGLAGCGLENGCALRDGALADKHARESAGEPRPKPGARAESADRKIGGSIRVGSRR
jgi:hypothetical protein